MSTSVELRAAFSPTADRGAALESIGMSVLRYALVLIFVLFSFHWVFGLLALAAVAAGIAWYARWERRRFPGGPGA